MTWDCSPLQAGELPRPLVERLVGVIQLIAVVLPVAIVISLLWHRRFVPLGLLAAAGTLRATTMAQLNRGADMREPVALVPVAAGGIRVPSEADDAVEGSDPDGIDDAVEVVDDVPVDAEGEVGEHGGVPYGDHSRAAGDR